MGAVALAIALFAAGIIEYYTISAWYNAFTSGHAIKAVILVHIQLLLWLFILNSLIAIIAAATTPWWVALAYIEGCALSVFFMTQRKKRDVKDDDKQ